MMLCADELPDALAGCDEGDAAGSTRQAAQRADTFRDARQEKFRRKQERLAAAAGATEPGGQNGDPPWLRRVEDAADASMAVFRDLKDASLVSRRGLFIAEGPETITLLLRSDVQVVSLLLKESAFALLRPRIEEAVSSRAGPGSAAAAGGGGAPFPVHVCSERLLSQVVGFTHRGSLAAGVVPAFDAAWLERAVLASLAADPGRGIRILAVERSTDTANLGRATAALARGMVRSAAAFGADLVLLGPSCCDPWYRRAVRTSVGHVFRVPAHRCADLPATLRRLSGEFRVESFAAVIDPGARALAAAGRVPRRWCLVVGNEQDGLSPQACAACSGGGLRIEMAPGVDSLNVGVATAVLLNGLREREEGREGGSSRP